MNTGDLLCITTLTVGAVFAQWSHAQAPQTTKFDGTWGVTLVCADYKGPDANAKGYAFRFLAYVKGGRIEGQYGIEDGPSSLHYSGVISEDGSAEIQARGFTGDPDYTVNRVTKATPYRYRLKAQFEGTRGHATRVDLRPCEATFVKQ
jgi:hypothetical protein